MTKIQDFNPYEQTTDLISLSWTSFNLVQPHYLKQKVKKIDEYLNDYREILKNFEKQNELIKGKLKIDGVEVFYNKGKELEKYLQQEIVQVAQISNFSEIVYERSMKERKQVLNKYIDLTKNNISRINLEIDLASKYDHEKEVQLVEKRRKLTKDIDKLNKLLMSDIN